MTKIETQSNASSNKNTREKRKKSKNFDRAIYDIWRVSNRQRCRPSENWPIKKRIRKHNHYLFCECNQTECNGNIGRNRFFTKMSTNLVSLPFLYYFIRLFRRTTNLWKNICSSISRTQFILIASELKSVTYSNICHRCCHFGQLVAIIVCVTKYS